MTPSGTSRKLTIICSIVALTLLGAVLRLWDLGGQSLWLDEAFTARVAPLDAAGIIAAIRSDLDTPPLHPFLVHIFLALGNSEFVLRLPSALAAIMSIPLLFIVTQRLLGRRSALFATALLAASPFAVYYAQEARMYSLVLLFALLALYCLLRLIDPHPNSAPSPSQGEGWGEGESPGRGERASAPSPSQGEGWGEGKSPARPQNRLAVWWLGFVLASALGLYTHFFGFFVLGLLSLYGLLLLAHQWRRGDRAEALLGLRNLALALAAVALLYLPWLPVLVSFVGENYAATPYGQGWQANLTLRTMLNMLTLMLGGYWAPALIRWGTRALFALGLLFMLRRRPAAALGIVLSIVLPFGAIALLNPGHFVTERYFVFMLPGLMMSMAEGLNGLARLASAALGAVVPLRSVRIRSVQLAVLLPALVALAVIAVLSVPGLHLYFAEPPKPAWRQLAHYVAGTVQPGDLIVVATFPHWDKEPLQHYLRVGGRRIVYAAEERNLRQLLANEHGHPWWIVYAGTERRLGRLMSAAVGKDFDVVPFDFLALMRRKSENADALDDGRAILTTLAPRIPGPYQDEVRRVIAGLASPSGDMGQPIAPPVPTTVR